MNKLNKPVLELDKDEFKYTQTPIGGPLYKHNVKKGGRPRVEDDKKKKPTDKIKCEVCGKEYIRSGATKHKRTVFHLERLRINKKLLDLLVN